MDKTSDVNKFLLKKAEEVGCFGLVGGVAKRLKTHEDCHAASTQKSEGPFYCGTCLSDAVLRRCIDKVDHFAHKTPLTPALPKGESELHTQCKETICSYLASKYPDGNWETERPIKENKARGRSAVRPDVSGRIKRRPIAIEVQASSLTIPEIIRRTKAYSLLDIAILWVVPLSEPLSESLFRPRQYERYFHSIYYGRVYYWWPELQNQLAPVHYGIAKRYIDYSSWYDVDGALCEAGGYDKNYKIIKKPNFGRLLNVDSDFYCQSRSMFTPENERKAVPACHIWRDSLSNWW